MAAFRIDFQTSGLAPKRPDEMLFTPDWLSHQLMPSVKFDAHFKMK